MKTSFRTPYTTRKRVGVSFEGDKGKTIQEQKESTDTKFILERYFRTGLIDHVNNHEPQYKEVSQFDYHETLNKVREVETMFLELPSDVRKDFDNDPQQFLDFLKDKDNVDDMRDGEIGNSESDEQLAAKDDSSSAESANTTE